MEQKIADLINPLPEIAGQVNESVEVPTNQFDTKKTKMLRILDRNKLKIILGFVGLVYVVTE